MARFIDSDGFHCNSWRDTVPKLGWDVQSWWTARWHHTDCRL